MRKSHLLAGALVVVVLLALGLVARQVATRQMAARPSETAGLVPWVTEPRRA